ncbi:MAG: CDP-diacylglycerol--glycerol-3-phosphate 3-phosphatidyltransferase [Chloroflexi bacterium]|nr:CDP-diacylglycerol--glycerol-3-phosphate 3-phosphatidyltransferase [Chloroflexota bacterium]
MQVPLNPANLLSFARLVATIPLVVLILLGTHLSLFAAALLFVVMAITDTVDGRLARRYGWVSNIGIFLDLTADKVYTAATLISMVAIGILSPWIAIVIIVREFVVTGLRSFAAAEGMVIPADKWGKHKMLLTIIAVVWMLVAASAGFPPSPNAALLPLFEPTGVYQVLAILLSLGYWLMIGAVLLTIYSGYEYMRKAAPLFRT